MFMFSLTDAINHFRLKYAYRKNPNLVTEISSIGEAKLFVKRKMNFLANSERIEIEDMLNNSKLGENENLIKSKGLIKKYLIESGGAIIIFVTSTIVIAIISLYILL